MHAFHIDKVLKQRETVIGSGERTIISFVRYSFSYDYDECA